MATTKNDSISVWKANLKKCSLCIAKRDRVPQATKATELLRVALEIEEDQVWAEIAQNRDRKGARFISHKKAWA